MELVLWPELKQIFNISWWVEEGQHSGVTQTWQVCDLNSPLTYHLSYESAGMSSCSDWTQTIFSPICYLGEFISM